MRTRAGVLIAVLVGLSLIGASGARAEDEPKPDAGMAPRRSIVIAPHKGRPGSQSGLDCQTTATPPNTKLDCDTGLPNNEPDIEIDPADDNHMIASSNDYDSCCDEFYTTFDGGATWQTGEMSHEGPGTIGSDPVTVFDTRHGTAIHGSLNFRSTGGGVACRGDLVVSISQDGGITWNAPVVVDQGLGCDNAKLQLFNDKEWLVTDNDPDSPFYGRTYITWSKFISRNGEYQSSPIWEAHSDDGGFTWSTPQEISGSDASLCTYQEDGEDPGHCDENQFSVPTVQPDGDVFVAFLNEQNEALWEPHEKFDDQYLVVRSRDGGETWSSPRFAVGLEDSYTRDYPLSVEEQQTLTGMQVRVNGAGNIVADPSTGKLWIVFSDNRAGFHDPPDPRLEPRTNTNIYLLSSTDDGESWTGPSPVATGRSDQWFPWVEVNPTDGSVGVLYNNRVPRTARYHVTLAEGLPDSFVRRRVTTKASHPNNSIFFQAHDVNCDKCATFHGDYIGLDYTSDGVAQAVWTDMRDFDPNPPGPGYRQFIYYAAME